MGDLNVRPVSSVEEKNLFYQSMLDDIAALDYMIEEGLFVTGDIHIGAEQELCIIDPNCNPGLNALEILDTISSDQFTHELGRFNMEVNLNPYPLEGSCFADIQNELINLLDLGRKKAGAFNNRLYLTGILPTLRRNHLSFENMTPISRYRSLSEALLKNRGKDFQVFLEGVDDLNTYLDSVLFEACNTSFQVHLQIDPNDFVAKYNWSQMIAGPVLSVAAGSPILFGRELWTKLRIALFKQSLDTRNFSSHIRIKPARVRFGHEWIRNSFSDLFKDQIARFPIILSTDRSLLSSLGKLNNGEIPKLLAINIHNGTTYCWNRPCYGFSGKKPHMRIECRYLPAGPSVLDEMANMAFWIGLMSGMPHKYERIWEQVNFRTAKDNFMRAARYGLSANYDWMGKELSAADLLVDILLPMASEGLRRQGVHEQSIESLLGIIHQRAEKQVNGAVWLTRNYRSLLERYTPNRAVRFLTQVSAEQQADIQQTVDEWPNISQRKIYPFVFQNETVQDYFVTDLYTVREDDPIGLVRKIFEWKKLNHILVESDSGELTGVVSSKDLIYPDASPVSGHTKVQDIMKSNVIYVDIHTPVSKAWTIMSEEHISSLPVKDGDQLVGIITTKDLIAKSSVGLPEY